MLLAIIMRNELTATVHLVRCLPDAKTIGHNCRGIPRPYASSFYELPVEPLPSMHRMVHPPDDERTSRAEEHDGL
jgi:hypothetical protein